LQRQRGIALGGFRSGDCALAVEIGKRVLGLLPGRHGHTKLTERVGDVVELVQRPGQLTLERVVLGLVALGGHGGVLLAGAVPRANVDAAATINPHLMASKVSVFARVA
jgi:hypothetical protein